VIAVDPSSQVSGGALLGDRTRLTTDPEDTGVFVRSMAARDRLGGLSDHAIAAVVLMRAVMDKVIVESVGIGQSEADVALVADTCVLCVQPGSGDSLQFMKAGIMELPDIICVTKADMGGAASRAQADVSGAISLSHVGETGWQVPVVLLSAAQRTGIDELLGKCAEHFALLTEKDVLQQQRCQQARNWLEDQLKTQFGSYGMQVAKALVPEADWDQMSEPFAMGQAVTMRLQKSWAAVQAQLDKS